jgi:hypothetical protein
LALVISISTVAISPCAYASADDKDRPAASADTPKSFEDCVKISPPDEYLKDALSAAYNAHVPLEEGKVSAKIYKLTKNLVNTEQGYCGSKEKIDKQISDSEKAVKDAKDANKSPAEIKVLEKKVASSKEEAELAILRVKEAHRELQKEKSSQTHWKNDFFFIHNGLTVLNPYKITPTVVDEITGTDKNGAFKIAKNKYNLVDTSSGNDTAYFLEAVFKKRAAWLGEKWKNSPSYSLLVDQELKLGLLNKGSNESISTMSGTGNAYIELSLGFNYSLLIDLPRTKNDGDFINRASEDLSNGGASSTYNVELIAGATTGNSQTHYYYGLGPAFIWSVPQENSRRIELLFGVYLINIDAPEVKTVNVQTAVPSTTTATDTTVNTTTNTYISEEKRYISTLNGGLEFKKIWSRALRGQATIPFGEGGYFTFSGQIFSDYKVDSFDNSTLYPWTIKAGVTLPLDEILSKPFKQ